MLDLPAADGTWAGVVALYSIIHLTAEERGIASREFARLISSGGCLLLAFHVDSSQFAPGELNRATSCFGEKIQLDGYFLDPSNVLAPLQAAGFALVAKLERQPTQNVARSTVYLASNAPAASTRSTRHMSAVWNDGRLDGALTRWDRRGHQASIMCPPAARPAAAAVRARPAP